MSALLIDVASWVLLVVGSIFVLIGALGLVRMPDFYTRMHAAGITDTLGADLILLGLMFQAGISLVTVKLLLIGAFLFFTSPTSTHAIANAAYTAGLRASPMDDEGDAPDKDPDGAGERP